MSEESEIKKSTGDIAKILMLTNRRVQQLSRAGILPRETPRGPFDLIPTVQSYIRYLKENGGLLETEVDGESHEQARTRLTKARADIHERTALQLSGHLIPLESIETAWVKILSQVRQHIIALPDRVAPRAHDAETLEETRNLLTQDCYEILKELAETKVEFDEAPALDADGSSRVGRRSVESLVRNEAAAPSDG